MSGPLESFLRINGRMPTPADQFCSACKHFPNEKCPCCGHFYNPDFVPDNQNPGFHNQKGIDDMAKTAKRATKKAAKKAKKPHLIKEVDGYSPETTDAEPGLPIDPEIVLERIEKQNAAIERSYADFQELEAYAKEKREEAADAKHIASEAERYYQKQINRLRAICNSRHEKPTPGSHPLLEAIDGPDAANGDLVDINALDLPAALRMRLYSVNKDQIGKVRQLMLANPLGWFEGVQGIGRELATQIEDAVNEFISNHGEYTWP